MTFSSCMLIFQKMDRETGDFVFEIDGCKLSVFVLCRTFVKRGAFSLRSSIAFAMSSTAMQMWPLVPLPFSFTISIILSPTTMDEFPYFGLKPEQNMKQLRDLRGVLRMAALIPKCATFISRTQPFAMDTIVVATSVIFLKFAVLTHFC